MIITIYGQVLLHEALWLAWSREPFHQGEVHDETLEDRQAARETRRHHVKQRFLKQLLGRTLGSNGEMRGEKHLGSGGVGRKLLSLGVAQHRPELRVAREDVPPQGVMAMVDPLS